jgi:hypothetical protein
MIEKAVYPSLAGNRTSGYRGKICPATDAQLGHPYGTAVESEDNIYIADSDNNRIRKVTPAGIIIIIAGN